MWIFWWEVNLCRPVFYHMFVHVLPLEIQLFRGEDCDTINWFIHVLPLEIQLFRGEDCDTINWFTPPIQALDFYGCMLCSLLICVQWVKVRGHCSFWPSLFQLLFIIVNFLFVIQLYSWFFYKVQIAIKYIGKFKVCVLSVTFAMTGTILPLVREIIPIKKCIILYSNR